MYTLGIKVKFDAAHNLPHYKGKCKNLHGHTWFVEAFFIFEQLQGVGHNRGMCEDFGILKTRLKKIVDTLDHSDLNDFLDNPTAEMISVHIFFKLKRLCKSLVKIKVWESPDCSVTYEDKRSI